MPTRVLLIDPEESVVEGFAKSLTVRGYEVITASSERECVGHLCDFAPDVVVLEPDAVGSWGRQLLAECLAYFAVPFVIVSRFSDTGVHQHAGIPWLVKPVSSATLADAVQNAGNRSRVAPIVFGVGDVRCPFFDAICSARQRQTVRDSCFDLT